MRDSCPEPHMFHGVVYYIPALDGLRAISVVIVVLSHFGLQFIPGLFGVTIFFFISGYLITSQLLAEIDSSGMIKLGSFYIRRMLRLYPALMVVVAVGTVAGPLLGLRVTVGDVMAALGYAANVWEQFDGFDPGVTTGWHPFGILWSLAVEEHYYLVFPMLVMMLRRHNRALLLTVLGLIVTVGAWRLALATSCRAPGVNCDPYRILHGTDTRVDSILFGALLAILLDGSLARATLNFVHMRTVFILGLGLLLAALVIRGTFFRDTMRFDLQGIGLLAVAGAILFQPRLAWLRGLLGLRPMIRLGRLSYSLYLWHWMVLSAAGAMLPIAWVQPLRVSGLPPTWWTLTVLPCLLAASLLGAAISYHGVEQPMVKLRRRFGAQAVADQVALTGIPVDSASGIHEA